MGASLHHFLGAATFSDPDGALVAPVALYLSSGDFEDGSDRNAERQADALLGDLMDFLAAD